MRIKGYYNGKKRSFVKTEYKRGLSWYQVVSLLAGVVLLSFVGIYGFDYFFQSPEEAALEEENEALRMQLEVANKAIGEFAMELETLVENDQDLFRVLLGADPIPEDVRRVGVGGTDPYQKFDRFSVSTAELLRTTFEMLDKVDRQVNLQNASYRELQNLARRRKDRLDQTPAIRPIANGKVASHFGERLHPILGYWRLHEGVDFPAPVGTPVHATADGTVQSIVRSRKQLGNYIVIKHPASELRTLYAHLSGFAPTLRRGQKITRGEVIGYSGNTGFSTAPHLHYEVQTIDGEPIDPLPYLFPDITPQEFLKQTTRERGTHSLD